MADLLLPGSIFAEASAVQVKTNLDSDVPVSRRARASTVRLGKTHAPVHVLVADANPASRADREQQLLAAGVRVSVARTAFEAIVKACCLTPDLILLDSALSDIDASETSQLLALCPMTAQIPVLRLSSGRRLSQRLVTGMRRQMRAPVLATAIP